jgi:hypothetical protein
MVVACSEADTKDITTYQTTGKGHSANFACKEFSAVHIQIPAWPRSYRAGGWPILWPVACCQLQDTGTANKDSLRRESPGGDTGVEPFPDGRVGVGRKKRVGDGWERTPPRKIRLRFRGYKHTSLAFLAARANRRVAYVLTGATKALLDHLERGQPSEGNSIRVATKPSPVEGGTHAGKA